MREREGGWESLSEETVNGVRGMSDRKVVRCIGADCSVGE